MLSFRGVEVSTGYIHKEQVTKGSVAWVEITPGRPDSIQLAITVNAPDGILPLTIFKSKAERLVEAFLLTVPVRWQDEAPITRQKGVDNVDVILLDKDGHFVDVQVGLVTRKGRFFMTAQQVYAGWVTRTHGAKVGQVVYDFVPSDSIHAYPGSDYSGIWAGMADELERVAREEGASTKLSAVKRKAAGWDPPHVAPTDGWRVGVAKYFNMITGTGRIVDAAEVDHFVHFSAIVGDESMKVLEPMTGVYFRPGKPTDQRQPGVKSIKPATAPEPVPAPA